MEKINLKNVEIQIDALIRHLARVKQENSYLLERQATLIRERNELLVQFDQAQSKVNTLIERLKYIGEWHE